MKVLIFEVRQRAYVTLGGDWIDQGISHVYRFDPVKTHDVEMRPEFCKRRRVWETWLYRFDQGTQPVLEIEVEGAEWVNEGAHRIFRDPAGRQWAAHDVYYHHFPRVVTPKTLHLPPQPAPKVRAQAPVVSSQRQAAFW